MKPIRSRLAAALLSIPLVAFAGRAEAACQMTKIATLHVTVEDNKILVPGSINGTPIQFIIATDIESMILAMPAHDMELFRFNGARLEPLYYEEELEIQPGGPVRVGSLVIDGLPMKDVLMHVIGRRQNFGKPTQTAVIGRDFLRKFDVEFNLPAGEVVLFHDEGCDSANLAYWTDSYNMLEMQHHGRMVRVQAAVNGQPVTADINSANPYTALNRNMARRLGLTLSGAAELPPSHDFLADRPIPTSQVMADSVKLDQEIIHPAALRIRELSTPPPLAQRSLSVEWDTETGYIRPDYDFVPSRGANHGADLSLGVDFIRTHRMLIAYSQYRVYFSHIPGQSFLAPTPEK